MALAVITLLISGTEAHDPQDQVLAQVGVDERLGAQVPRELPFRDQNGSSVLLGEYFTGGPVVLTLNYYGCPTLCPLVFRNLADAIGELGELRLDKDFRIVTVSINPDESQALAREKSAATYAMLRGTINPAQRWPFLMGSGPAIERLAQSVGVRYTRVGKEFAHPNVIVILTPRGRVSRYLYGLEQSPRDLKLALIEASGGTIGGSTFTNNALLYCFHYDPVGKKYVLFASRLMTAAMVAVLILMVGMLAIFWRREHKQRG